MSSVFAAHARGRVRLLMLVGRNVLCVLPNEIRFYCDASELTPLWGARE